ncbi:MAG: hypothetical protein A2031_02970 [Deltaproteobacteria bacterium RBG_19FT_COMBO_43_11]|nr:MAG: hypothetical protein A2W27_02665 [Deltaproteobacteria bacterium RBG_16_44_11]OGP89174.1 MAG: hypothetical protein A2031_02970 [Deltaproteobacteria bacterium RBG_19FT_COMBO_43_11]
MELINRKNKPYKIIPAVCFSLLIHVVVGTLLIFGLSRNINSLPSLNGLNWVWVSLDANNSNSVFPLQQKPPGSKHTVNQKHGSEATAAVIIAAMESAKPIKLANYETYDPGKTNESSAHMDSYSSNQNIGDASKGGAVTAYPLYRENMPPIYPEIARVRGYEGVVLIAAEILPTGRVGNAKIRQSSGYAILDQSALEAVKPWRFEPAKKSGKPFTFWVEVPIKFVLHNNKSQS